MKRINSLEDLMMEELADLFNAENQLLEALPKMIEASHSPTLKGVLEAHWKITKDQIFRLQDIFNNIGQDTQRTVCKTIKRLIAESEDVINTAEKSAARDGIIISIVQRVKCYEITGYQIACDHAMNLGHTWIIELLNETLSEERAINLHLNELAQCMINIQAIDPSGSIIAKRWVEL